MVDVVVVVVADVVVIVVAVVLVTVVIVAVVKVIAVVLPETQSVNGMSGNFVTLTRVNEIDRENCGETDACDQCSN